VTSGTTQNFTYSYDRYGNRTAQTVTAGSGPQPGYTITPTTNQIAGYTYDAAGNMTYDGTHHYTYDAEGNITQVDSGATATYSYNALNQRVRIDKGATAVEFIFNLGGQRVSEWDGHSFAQLRGQYYWGAQPLAYYDSSTHFQHQDYLGTARLQTSCNGTVEGSYFSLPWGDGFTDSGSGVYGGGTSSDDAYHFAGLDHDFETNTDHAQYRNYSPAQGRWLTPDPYDGSYDITNPQSFNRYAYVMNNPLSAVDPLGLNLVLQCDNNGENCTESNDGNGPGDGGGSDCKAPGTDTCATATPPPFPDTWELSYTGFIPYQPIQGFSPKAPSNPSNPNSPKSCADKLANIENLVNATSVLSH